jgi:hypothetical protein
MQEMFSPISNLVAGLGVLIPLAGYHLTLWYFQGKSYRLRNTGRLSFHPNTYNCETVVVGGQYTYLDCDSYDDYFWVRKVDQKLGLIQISLHLEDGGLVRSPFAGKYWAHEIPKDRPFNTSDLSRTRMEAILSWINSDDVRDEQVFE